MRTVDIIQAAGSLPEYGREKRGETWLLTRRGRPVAAVVPLDDEDAFSMRVANDPRFIEIIKRSRARYKATGGLTLAEMRKKYGLEKRAPRPKRRAAARKAR
jgi:antitoxin (DNA-binding transcriptional repressor) of toxin-antitoxin stability system